LQSFRGCVRGEFRSASGVLRKGRPKKEGSNDRISGTNFGGGPKESNWSGSGGVCYGGIFLIGLAEKKEEPRIGRPGASKRVGEVSSSLLNNLTPVRGIGRRKV